MSVDHRVANAVAKRSICHLFDKGFMEGGGFDQLVRRQTVRGGAHGMPTTAKGARRYIQEMAKLVSPFALHVEQGECKKKGPHLAWLGLEAIHLDNGLAENTRRLRPDTLCLIRFMVTPMMRKHSTIALGLGGVPLALFSEHSIARLHQRAEILDIKATSAVIKSALPGIVFIGAMNGALGIKQPFLRTQNGLFVGDWSDRPGLEKCLHIKTFIGGLHTEMAPRWEKCHAITTPLYEGEVAEHLIGLSMGMERHRPKATHEQIIQGLNVATWEHQMLKICDELSETPHHWLRNTYQPLTDLSKEAWAASKEGAA